MGYGREAYVWSMFAAFGLFTAGAVVSIMHGIQQIIAPEPAADFAVAYAVLAAAFVLEGISFVQAFRQTRKAAHQLERHTLEQVLISSDPDPARGFRGGRRGPDWPGRRLCRRVPAPGHRITVAGRRGLHRGRHPAGGRRRRADRPQPAFPGGPGRDPRHRTVHGPPGPGAPEIARLTYLHLRVCGPPQAVPGRRGGPAGRPPEHEVAVALRRIERELEDHETVEEAVLTLATPDEPELGLRRRGRRPRRAPERQQRKTEKPRHFNEVAGSFRCPR